MPGWKPPTKVHERRSARRRRRSPSRASRSSTQAAACFNAEASSELLALVETGGLPAVVTLMGKGCLPDSHPLNYGAPGMHGSKYANWALNKCDLIHRDRHALRRPRHRQGLRVRAGCEGDPLRHRRRRGREDPHCGDPRRRPAQARTHPLTRELKELEQRDRVHWHQQLQEWNAALPVQVRKAEGVLKPQTVLETLRDIAAERTGT